jgi:hypothetical protein
MAGTRGGRENGQRVGFPAGRTQRGARLAGRIAAGRHESERARVQRALEGDARAFRNLYDSCFRLAWACSLRMTGDPRRAERLTAHALRDTFSALRDFDGTVSLGCSVLARLEAAFGERGGVEPLPIAAPAEQRDGA